MRTRVGYSGPLSLFLIFGSAYFLTNQAGLASRQTWGATAGENSERGANPPKVRATTREYVLLSVVYEYEILGEYFGYVYTEIKFGRDQQTLKLLVDVPHLSWVPQLPASQTEFCNNQTNYASCRTAGNSGYYSPGDVSHNDTFNFPAPNTNYTGYWVEDIVTAGNISVNLQFVVAETWGNMTPRLGLGLWPFDMDARHPSYIQALQQQGRISEQFCSCYDITNAESSGSIVIGGVDLNKFTGKLKVWRINQLPGIISTPATKIISSSGNWTNFTTSSQEFALFTPLSSFLHLPKDVLDSILTLLPASPFTVGDGRKVYTLPCDIQVDPTWVINFTFDELVISIPFTYLISPLKVSEASAIDQCLGLFLPNEKIYYDTSPYDFSYIFGAPFWRSAYIVVNAADKISALGVANPNVTTQAIVDVGGQFGANIDTVVGTPPASSTPPSDSGAKKKHTVGVIVGSCIGGIALIFACLGGYFLYWRRREKPMPVVPDVPKASEEEEIEMQNLQQTPQGPGELNTLVDDLYDDEQGIVQPRQELAGHERVLELPVNERLVELSG
ncbi:hypothetical protein H072_4066 [Dactylellina haptotyla CBS 200.50]|uniref:Peptidase A1 domain-containing protein n=1 Tax=Dactylellina haptotyla (strain CBS 200.50) TaxID=1284197 RepID=S8ALN9_DACHA|nr:hypothetical protein H072_4066 [Dactylellina haptotyla CBS 200.50]